MKRDLNNPEARIRSIKHLTEDEFARDPGHRALMALEMTLAGRGASAELIDGLLLEFQVYWAEVTEEDLRELYRRYNTAEARQFLEEEADRRARQLRRSGA